MTFFVWLNIIKSLFSLQLLLRCHATFIARITWKGFRSSWSWCFNRTYSQKRVIRLELGAVLGVSRSKMYGVKKETVSVCLENIFYFRLYEYKIREITTQLAQHVYLHVWFFQSRVKRKTEDFTHWSEKMQNWQIPTARKL